MRSHYVWPNALRERRRVLRAGVTLAELLVALVVMSIIAGVAALSLNRMSPVLPRPAWQDSLAAARKRAITEAHRVTLEIPVKGRSYYLTALPDGRVIADPALGIDQLTGEVPNEP